MSAPPPESTVTTTLRALERVRADYGGGAAATKLSLLHGLAARRLETAGQVVRLHEALCFLRAYPDDRRVLAQVERMLARFDRRRDLARHRARLASTGIAGTEIRFRFFAAMANWLARRWPRQLAVDWKQFDHRDELERLLPLLVHYGESPALDEYDFTLEEWLRKFRGPGETDATFLIRRFEALRMDGFAREALYDGLDVPMVLAPSRDGPSRTRARYPSSRVAFQARPLSRSRPDLARDLMIPPRAVRAVNPREGQRLIDLALESMVTRQRDLDVFTYADPRDVRMVDDGGGLQFACLGALPERRLLLESVYGYLTLKNGVPIGYVLTSALFGSAEIAFNVFETFRGVEAAHVYGRALAMVRHLFDADAFTIYPYQLGEGNEEGLASGAWWFYQKLGFRPRERAARALMNRELALMKRDPAHRSSIGTLRRLARSNVYFHLRERREDVIGLLPLANVGLHVTRYLARRFGADRELATATCAREAAERLGAGPLSALSRDERLAWERWAPLALILPGIERWSRGERRALAEVIRAKGGRRESDFVLRFDRHPRLPSALARLANREPRP